MIHLKFKKKLRLLNYKNFQSVFRNSFKEEIHGIILFGKLNNLNIPRIGIIISKKYIKMSNKRNKIKRLIRESFRLNQIYIPHMDFIILIKNELNIIYINDLKKILENLWKKYHQKFLNS